MIRRALIGHTGFVGSNLRASGRYTDLYNSSNFGTLVGETYDEIVCAGIPAVKWLANREPEQDWAGILRLLEVLATTKARRFVLISTIDVYPNPASGLDETADLNELPNHAYGRHRLAVEGWVAERFPDHLIVRLPALFGPGLKKNALYDLLNNNGIDKINPAAIFQWYPADRLSGDMARAAGAGLRLVNFFTEPVAMQAILQRLFPSALVAPPSQPAPVYNLRTRYADLFGGHDGFVLDVHSVMAALAGFVAEVRRERTEAS